jgi:hypothetical protein
MDFSRNVDSAEQTSIGKSLPEVGVHVLSENVFCPRAALLAYESGDDDGQAESDLGPRLDEWIDYDAHRFAEGLSAAWGDLRLWLTLLAPAGLAALVMWQMVSPLAGIVAALPAFYLAGRIWDTSMSIIDLVREQGLLDAAPVAEIDLAPSGVIEVNWWTLRKAGFDCLQPVDAHRDPGRRLSGRPWRMLTKGTTLRIPVVRKHHGERSWGRQHVVRLAAYCQLIETCEGADAPFGVLLFADTYDCVIFPYTADAKAALESALQQTRELIGVYEEGRFLPTPPTDNRCSGCHFGRPRRYNSGSATVLNGQPMAALPTRAVDNKVYHSHCGDRFNWVPPHEKSAELGITK